ncbi:MAG TPA: peptide chain release factor 1 [Nitrospiria bacterium]|nr:peptide chain release factor 1 [Nitrospiria bacterium]
MILRLETLASRFAEVERNLGDPSVIADPQALQRLSKERAELADVVGQYQAYCALVTELEQTRRLAEDPRSEPTFRELALDEAQTLEVKRAELYDALRIALLPKDPRDEKNIFLEIRAGTGGSEAALFAAELFRMYGKYAETKRWRVELVSSSETGIGGMKEAIVLIEGKGAYSRLKFESGVHRVQRVPVTEASGRIHTSTVTVAVVPEAEEVEYHIDAKDLRIDTFCSSGPGGQSVNTTYSAVRITHIPTNTVVSCQDERSQTKNRAKAMRILRSRLVEVERERQEAEIAKDRKAQVGTGERSEKVRTYNFPQNRVTDHRIGLTLHRLDQVLNGDLDELIDALQAWTQTAQLQRL